MWKCKTPLPPNPKREKTAYSLPASGGPTVMGMEKMPKRNPSACDAPVSPTRSKAIGPSRQMNSPSHRPITRQITISEVKLSANGMHRVVTPSNRKAVCCMCTRFRHLTSASSPKRIRETPEVMLIHIGRRLPFEPGKMSLVC